MLHPFFIFYIRFMSSSFKSPNFPSDPDENVIVRNYGKYSLSFPCDPNELRTTTLGFQFLFWADLLLVAALWIFVGTVFWFSTNSESFRTFFQELTPERMELLKSLPQNEIQQIFMNELPMEELSVPGSIFSLLFLGGSILNVTGTCLCMSCPRSIVPNAHYYGLTWFGAFLLSGIMPFFGPLVFLFAWQYWLTFLQRLSYVLGEKEAPYEIRRIHRLVFYTILAFLGVTLFISDDSSASYLQVFCIAAVLVFFLLGFLRYARVLRLLRNSVIQMIHFWNYGNETLEEPKPKS